MEVEIIRQKRRTMVLKVIDENHAVVKVPMSLSETRIKEFVDDKQEWMRKIVEKMQSAKSFSQQFDFDKFIYLSGEQVAKVADVIIGADKLSTEKRRALIKKYYLTMFENLKSRALELSQMTGLKFKDVKPTSSTRIWGSYNTKAQMKLNWKLLLVPDVLRDYVICHELCHSLYMNHKPKFWASLEKICPKCRLKRKELSRFDFILKVKF